MGKASLNSALAFGTIYRNLKISPNSIGKTSINSNQGIIIIIRYLQYVKHLAKYKHFIKLEKQPLHNRCYNYPHFTGEKTEGQRM